MAVPKKNQLVGLDIGSHSIKLAEIEQGKRGRLLKNFGVIEVPRDAIVEDSIMEIEAAASAIKLLFRNLRVKNRNVAVSLSGYSVIAKKVALDKIDESEIEATIQKEAEKHVPFDINDVNLDFALLSPDDEAEGVALANTEAAISERMGLMLVAAKKSVIDRYLDLIRAADLNPGVLDVDVFALQNAVEISVDQPERCHVIINVGAKELGINVVSRGESIFSRDSLFGGAMITEAIMSELTVGFEQAEKIKLGGVDLDDDGKKGLKKIIVSEVSAWVKEIKRALDFVCATYADETIGEIILCGGSSRIPGFLKYLEMETGIPVRELNPFRNLVIDSAFFDRNYLDYMAPHAGIAVGLALRSINDK